MARLQQFQLSETIDEETAFGQFAAVYGLRRRWRATPCGPRSTRGSAPRPRRPSRRTRCAPTASSHPPRWRASLPPASNLSKWKDVLAATRDAASLRCASVLRPADATVGSNNWVVSGAKSATTSRWSRTIRTSSLQYPPLFHLSVMTSTNRERQPRPRRWRVPRHSGRARRSRRARRLGRDRRRLRRHRRLPRAVRCRRQLPGRAAPCVHVQRRPRLDDAGAADVPRPHRPAGPRRLPTALRHTQPPPAC